MIDIDDPSDIHVLSRRLNQSKEFRIGSPGHRIAAAYVLELVLRRGVGEKSPVDADDAQRLLRLLAMNRVDDRKRWLVVSARAHRIEWPIENHQLDRSDDQRHCRQRRLFFQEPRSPEGEQCDHSD
jgi:hypothetical protein